VKRMGSSGNERRGKIGSRCEGLVGLGSTRGWVQGKRSKASLTQDRNNN